MKVLEYEVMYRGPMAEHNFPCPVYGCTNKAVLEYGTPGKFQPCWECQHDGYITVKAKGWKRAILRWLGLTWR